MKVVVTSSDSVRIAIDETLFLILFADQRKQDVRGPISNRREN